MLQIQRQIAVICAAAFLLGLAPSGMAQQSTRSEIESRTQHDYERVQEFLDYLKPTKGVAGGFKASNAPRWDIARLLSFMADEGIETTDVNSGEQLVRYSSQQLRAAVKTRNGTAFEILSHLGHIYAQPYPQYSELRFDDSGSDLVVHVAGWYRLTFAQRAGDLRLIRIDYLELEGD